MTESLNESYSIDAFKLLSLHHRNTVTCKPIFCAADAKEDNTTSYVGSLQDLFSGESEAGSNWFHNSDYSL